MFRSLRTRLCVVLASGFVVGLLGFGAYLDHQLRSGVLEEFDATLLAEARTLALLIDQEEGQVEFDYKPKFLPQYEREDLPHHFQISLDGTGELLRSGRLMEDLPGCATVPPGGTETGTVVEPLYEDTVLADGRVYRIVHFRFRPRSGGEDDIAAVEGGADADVWLNLAVARGREHLDGTLFGVRALLLGVGALATALGFWFAWRVLDRGLRPIDDIVSQLGELDAERLGERIRGGAAQPRELDPVVDHTNALLGRLEAAFERERRFTSNVAHELRTPIAELRMVSCVASTWPEDRDAIQQFFCDVQGISARMETVVSDLLLLARCQAGAESVSNREPTDIVETVRTAWRTVEDRAVARGLRLRMVMSEPTTLETDRSKFAMIIVNLLDNAVSYAKPDTEVVCAVASHPGRVRVAISNSADPLGSESLDRLTEPFWRKDMVCGPTDHSGLGLALVVALAELLDMQIHFSQAQANGDFCVEVDAPAPTGFVRSPVQLSHRA